MKQLSFNFNKENFLEILSLLSKNNPELILNKPHFNYLVGYLNDLKCLTIVVEYEYIDKDFLDDYAEYFVKCFTSYNRFCSRVHFFSQAFSEEEYKNFLMNKKTITHFHESYLGFCVIKSLPHSIIGKTCLKPYEKSGRRFYGTIREYEVNFYGIFLKIHSLAYQEQDGETSACATSALWSVFQATGKLFQHEIPTPVYITKKAVENMPKTTRGMPNEGLTAEEIAKAIQSVSLDSLCYNLTDMFFFKLCVYAYMNLKLPLLLGVSLYDIKEKKYLGNHAVTLTGYSINKEKNELSDELNYMSNKIEKFYIHDDQIGPFARSEIVKEEILIEELSLKSTYYLSSSWNQGNIIMIPSILIIPLYKKIRINLSEILNKINNRVFYLINHFSHLVQFDLKLYTISSLKDKIRNNEFIDNFSKERILLKNFPKYLWVLEVYINKKLSIIEIYDATDIKSNHFLMDAVFFT